jgi:hypothetical protein
MRVIIEVDNEDELREALSLLWDRVVEVRERPSISRQDRLRQIFRKYRGRLPEGYRLDRDDAHDR